VLFITDDVAPPAGDSATFDFPDFIADYAGDVGRKEGRMIRGYGER